VENKLAAGTHLLPIVTPNGVEVPVVARTSEPQFDLRRLVSKFAIKPNSRQQGPDSLIGRARPAHTAQSGDNASGGDFSGKLPALGSLSELADVQTDVQHSSGRPVAEVAVAVHYQRRVGRAGPAGSWGQVHWASGGRR